MSFLSPDNLDILVKLALAAFLGSLIGLEREISRKNAGLRTYALVTVGACIFTLVSIYGVQAMIAPPDIYASTPGFRFNYNYDVSRVLSNIAVGIGFLGAGIVVFNREKVLGLTTAAGIWVAAAIGAAVGIGAYFMAIVSALLMLFILIVLHRAEMIIKNNLNTEKAKTDEPDDSL